MTVSDLISLFDFGFQKISIRNRQKFCYFEGELSELIKLTTKLMTQVKGMAILGVNTTVSHGDAWVVITVAD